ncbi:hypothetical protein P7C70_g419, partial [Phenoliferia sp. Uapishka_3]
MAFLEVAGAIPRFPNPLTRRRPNRTAAPPPPTSAFSCFRMPSHSGESVLPPSSGSTGDTELVSASEPSTEDESSFERISEAELCRHFETYYSSVTDAHILLAINYAYDDLQVAYSAGQDRIVRAKGVYISARSRWLAFRMKSGVVPRRSGSRAHRLDDLHAERSQLQKKRARHSVGRGRALAREGTWSWIQAELCGEGLLEAYGPKAPIEDPSSLDRTSSGRLLLARSEVPVRSARLCEHSSDVGVALCTDSYSTPLAATLEENKLAILYCESDLTYEECKGFFGLR